ncbi:MAG: DNA-binding protein WhiA, partial [Eggerthellaceae bacterium]|nr:DNA-binding protein WhiA [Eggerthellaceae bacterium]
MSFTSDVKEELVRVAPTCSHCEKATLAALVRIEGTLVWMGSGNRRLEMATDSPNVARLIVRLLHTIYDLKTELTMRRSVLHKTPNYLINVPMQENLPIALQDMGVVKESGFEQGIDPQLVAKRCCAAAYLRGAFLGSGFIANPRGDFHFELTVEHEMLAQDMVNLLSERGINARYMQRRSNYIIYMKSGTAISEFLALVGAHQCALAMENERVVKSVRNDVNRRVNAELAN